MLLALAIILAVIWIVSFAAFHVTAAAIHLLIIAAVIAAIAYLITAARGGPRTPRAVGPMD